MGKEVVTQQCSAAQHERAGKMRNHGSLTKDDETNEAAWEAARGAVRGAAKVSLFALRSVLLFWRLRYGSWWFGPGSLFSSYNVQLFIPLSFLIHCHVSLYMWESCSLLAQAAAFLASAFQLPEHASDCCSPMFQPACYASLLPMHLCDATVAAQYSVCSICENSKLTCSLLVMVLVVATRIPDCDDA